MRIRNVKNKKEILDGSFLVIKNPEEYKGKWNKLFNNDYPIHVEIGSGKCKFLKELSQKYPKINFIGIEKSASVLALGIRDTNNTKYPNLHFINYNADLVENIFAKEIDKLYLNFSDPWPKAGHTNRRLTSPIFLNKYENIFKYEKCIALKTDNRAFFEYSLKTLVEHNYLIKTISLDLHNSQISDNILTEYEEKFIAKNACIFFMEVSKK